MGNDSVEFVGSEFQDLERAVVVAAIHSSELCYLEENLQVVVLLCTCCLCHSLVSSLEKPWQMSGIEVKRILGSKSIAS